MDAEKIGAQRHHVPPHSYSSSIEPVHKTHHVFSSIQEYPTGKISKKTKKITEEGEIGVFGAEKYFSMQLDSQSPVQDGTFQGRYHHKQETQESTRWRRSRCRSGTGTPSIRSESSYNSQTVLLRSSMKDNNTLSQIQQRKTNGTTVSFGGFRCNGPCSGGKSVHVSPNLNDTRREIHNPRKHIHKARIHMKNEPVVHITPKIGNIAHGSKIEEFFPLPAEKADIAVHLEKKLSMLTWDAIPNAPNYLSINNNSAGGEDMESDASSDLFEIETITGAYKPSEASLEWSVATRSVADFSVASDFGEKNFPEKKTKYSGNSNPRSKFAAEEGRTGGLLSGCKSLKAVNVVETKRSERKFRGGFRVQDLDFL